ncbi:MAG: restriction endonuclease subunit S [Paludibacteraceae bacterium]|nr:restriction endonuclease subunit S [Paludibacteraceae bacterium]
MSWKKIKLSEFLKNRNGRYKPNDIAISDFKRIDKIDFSGNIFISDKASNTDMILVKKGDLVISGINIEKGAMTVYEGDNDITATIHYSSYIYDKEKIDIEFLKYFLKSSEFKQAIKEQVPGGIKTEIKPKHLLPLEVFIPTTIQEQKIVVENLKSIEKENLNLAKEISTQLDLVKQLRQSFLREAMQGKLVAQNPADGNAKDLLEKIKAEKAKSGKKEKPLPPIKEDEIPFEIPENWVWCRLGEICNTRLGKMLDGIKNKGTLSPYLRNLNVQWNSFNLKNILEMRFEEHELEEYSVKKGDLLICEGGYPGRGAIWESEDESFKFQKALHRVRFYYGIPAKLYLFYLELICSNGRIDKYLTGSGIQHLTGISLKKMPISLPPLPEQKRIVEKLDELMRMCDELEQSIKSSQGQNEKLLQQVLREALRG